MDKRTAWAQRGFTLTEALVAFGVTATGLLAVASFQGGLLSNSAYNKARTEALALAQQKIEEFKHYTLADESDFIDENGDGVMDADGNYTEAAINGQNAIFTRSWDIVTLDHTTQIGVDVGWLDSSGQNQTVSLNASIPWISPRSAADQIATLPPSLGSPGGRARRGEGELYDYPNAVPVAAPGDDGLSTYQNEENLLLVDSQNNVLLTLLDVCDVDTSVCSDFVKISGTVYFDTANTRQDAVETYVVPTDAAHCQRWVPSGTLTKPPLTASRDYEYFHYTCYVGGGWYGNIGIVTAPGDIQQTDKVCQGDPTSLNAWEQTVIGLRRVYRGMLQHTVGGQTLYESHGIKDAAVLTGQDFVFTSLAATQNAGSYCRGLDAPMTRPDSDKGTLFRDVPTDFVCLNMDVDGDQSPDYLDSYDTSVYSAGTTCPFDPTDPPVATYHISGDVVIVTSATLDLSSVAIVTSDGPGNCVWTAPFASSIDGYSASYSCNVYDAGSGWSGYVQIQPNSDALYCPGDTANFTDISGDQSESFACMTSSTITIQGTLSLIDAADLPDIQVATPAGGTGYCRVGTSTYQCQLPYEGTATSLLLNVTSNDVVCGGESVLFVGLTGEGSPYNYDIAIANSLGKCP